MISRSLRRAGFTLIEILTVIAIIAVLASLILATSGFVQEKAGRSRAEAEIQALSNAIEAYKLDFGEYPQPQTVNAGSDSDSSTKILIEKLCPPSSAAGSGTQSSKVYFEIPSKMLQGYKSGTNFEQLLKDAKYLVDPFGNAYHYQYPGDKARNGEQFFDLWSYGKKGSKISEPSPANEAQWIKNW